MEEEVTGDVPREGFFPPAPLFVLYSLSTVSALLLCPCAVPPSWEPATYGMEPAAYGWMLGFTPQR